MAIWSGIFAFLLLAATVPVGTAISNLASWAQFFHLPQLAAVLSKTYDQVTRYLSYVALAMALVYHSIQAYELIQSHRAKRARQ